MKNKFLILSVILILVFSLTGCSGKQNSSKSAIKEKVNSELEYLDTQLLGMLNKINNISFQKYLVISEEISSDSANNSSESGSDSASKGENSSTQSEGEDSSSSESDSSQGGSSESSDTSSGGDSSSSASTDGSNNTSIKYSMQSHNVINRDTNINWEEFNTDIENLYGAWSAITIDLYKQEIDNSLVLNFSSELQNVLNSIKAQDKNSTLVNLAKLYSFVPQFSTIVNGENMKTSILKTKSGLMNAYALVEQGDWQKIQTELNVAEQNYMPVLNGIISNKNKEYNINKAYVLIKETRQKC